ncbi:unnamed protein product, partial [Heterosigma akashiwo]
MGNSSSPGVKSKLSHLGSGGRGESYDSNGRLQELMSMGFSEADSRASLNAAKGNVQVATNYLLNSKMGGKASVGADQNADLEMQRALQLSLAGGGGGGEETALQRALRLSLREEELVSSGEPPTDDQIVLRPEYEQQVAKKFEHVDPVNYYQTVLKAMLIFKRRAHHAHEVVEARHHAEERQAKGRFFKRKASSGQPNPNHPPPASPQLTREETINEGKVLLAQRLRHLDVRDVQMADDGNCQFRAFSQELYGTQRAHGHVRRRALAYIEAHAGDFGAFFAEGEFPSYLAKMHQPRTWGDELTLRAVAESYGIKVHVITSTEDNWYLHYDPTEIKIQKQVFLTYVSPIHYNCIDLDVEVGGEGREVPG